MAKKIFNLLYKIIFFLSGILFLFFAVLSFGETQTGYVYGKTPDDIIPLYKIHDNPLWHILAVTSVFLFFLMSDRIHRRKTVLKFSKYHFVFPLAMALIAGFAALAVVYGGVRHPYGDQAQLYGAAMYFNEGNYIQLSPGGYLDLYPHQLGYVLYLQTLFRITGSTSYYLVQIINCFFIAGILWRVYTLAKCMTEMIAPRIAAVLFAALTLSLPLYASFIYGDIPSIFFSLGFIRRIMQIVRSFHASPTQEKGRTLPYVLAFADITLAILFKKNAEILLIAAVLTLLFLLVYARITGRSKFSLHMVIFLFFLCVTPVLAPRLVHAHYSHLSGYSVSGGLPSVSWVAMGTIEDGSPGWFNNYPVPVYYSVGFDREQTAERAIEKLKSQFSFFTSHPVYALSFYKRKIATQWNDPLFNAQINYNVEENAYSPARLFQDHIYQMSSVLSVVQNMVYFGVLLYSFSIGKDILKYTKKASYELPSTAFIALFFEFFVLGQFFFSIIWEANSRFTILCYLFMIPMSATGYSETFSKWISSMVSIAENRKI